MRILTRDHYLLIMRSQFQIHIRSNAITDSTWFKTVWDNRIILRMVVTASKLIPVALKKSTSLKVKCTASVHWRIFVSKSEIFPQTGVKYSSAAEQNICLLGINLKLFSFGSKILGISAIDISFSYPSPCCWRVSCRLSRLPSLVSCSLLVGQAK